MLNEQELEQETEATDNDSGEDIADCSREDMLNCLQDRIANIQASDRDPLNDSRSAQIKDLFAALANAQSQMKIAGMKGENLYFKNSYEDIVEIVKASRPALTSNGLSVIQQLLPNEDGQLILHTILGHESGQWIESRMRIIPAKNDVHSLVSYIIYIRRMAYAALVCCVATGEDDDGEVAMQPERDKVTKGVALNTKYDPRKNSSETITKEQLDELNYELSEYPDIAEMVLDGLKIQHLADMPKTLFLKSVEKIRKIKQARNGK